MAISSRPTATPAAQSLTLRVLLAPFKNLWLAIPMHSVRKIMRIADVVDEGVALPATIAVEDITAKVINLYEQIYGVPNPLPDTHLVALQLASGQGFALPMAKLPTILNLEATAIKSIPADYRDLYRLDLASHISLLPQGKEEITVFVIDPEKLSFLE
jgi:hypothetical protein